MTRSRLGGGRADAIRPCLRRCQCVSEATLALVLEGDLDTVAFVRDYVEVRINYNVVRCLTGQIVRTPSRE